MKYALVQQNGRRTEDSNNNGRWVIESTVFGVGDTPDAARHDAIQWLAGESPDDLTLIEVDQATYDAIMKGSSVIGG
jgi:hypothetical protein